MWINVQGRNRNRRIALRRWKIGGKIAQGEYEKDVPKNVDHITGVETTVKSIEIFCRTKKNIFLIIRDGISEILDQLERSRTDMKWAGSWVDLFEYHLRIAAGKKTEEAAERSRVDAREESCQTAWQPEARSTLDLREWPREPTVNPEKKSLRASSKEEEWAEVRNFGSNHKYDSLLVFILNYIQILMNKHDSASITLKYIFCFIASTYCIIEFKHKHMKMWTRTSWLN